MSRYDYRDPGTDPAYCDGLDWRNDVTRDSDPADQEAAGIDVPDFDQPDELAGLTPEQIKLAHDLDRVIEILDPSNPPVDLAEHAAQSLLVAIADVQRHLQQVRTLEEGQRVQKWVRLAWKALDRLALDASEIIDQAIERSR